MTFFNKVTIQSYHLAAISLHQIWYHHVHYSDSAEWAYPRTNAEAYTKTAIPLLRAWRLQREEKYNFNLHCTLAFGEEGSNCIMVGNHGWKPELELTTQKIKLKQTATLDRVEITW